MFPSHLHRGPDPRASFCTHPQPSASPRPPPIQYKYYKYLINIIDKVKRATSRSCAVLHVFVSTSHFGFKGKIDARIFFFFFQTPEPYEMLFKKEKKNERKERKKKKLQRNSSRARKKVYCLTQRTFYVLPLFFMSCNEWTEIQRPLYISILRL